MPDPKVLLVGLVALFLQVVVLLLPDFPCVSLSSAERSQVFDLVQQLLLVNLVLFGHAFLPYAQFLIQFVRVGQLVLDPLQVLLHLVDHDERVSIPLVK